MRTAHLILTYTDPHLTERVIKKMTHEDFDFYIHVDKKFDIAPFLFLTQLPNVYLIKNRLNVNWACFDTVQATFESIKEIVATGIEYNFINFISGQDYPLKSAGLLADFFRNNKGTEFMSFHDILNDWPEGQIRMEKYFLSNYKFKGKYTLERLMDFFLPKRKVPYHLRPYGKSMFWMLSPAAAMYVVNEVQKDKKMINFFTLCWGSDEFVFQTMLMNSHFKDKVVNNNHRYIDWSAGGASPKTLDESDFEPLKASGDLFTRKVSATVSAKLLDLIDSKLLN